ncbi:MAG: hypothetical protein ACE5KV_04335 [Thermoplasmata archaeon]
MTKDKLGCPNCGISAKMENLENHVRKVHPYRRVELPEVVIEPKRAKGRLISRRGTITAVVAAIAIVAVIVVLLSFRREEPERPNYAPTFYGKMYGQICDLNERIGPRPINDRILLHIRNTMHINGFCSE